MKKITFFNEKGGTGKTLYNMLFASWLAYEKGKRVYALDFDFPSYQFFKTRTFDIKLLQENEEFAKLVKGKPYELGKIAGKEAYSRSELASIVEKVREMSVGDGYLIMDFPGRFLPNDPAHALAAAGLLDFIIFPVDTDRQSRTSALFVNSVVNGKPFLARNGKEHQDTLILWNRETRTERSGKRDFYSEHNELFNLIGIPVCTTRAREILSFRRDGDTFGFFRSTLCYPKINITRTAPWLEDIFEEILARIDGTWKDGEVKKEEQA